MRKISSTMINPAAARNSLRGDDTVGGTGLPGAAVCALSDGRRGHGSMLPGNLPLISADAMLWQGLPTLPPERTEGLCLHPNVVARSPDLATRADRRSLSSIPTFTS